MKRKIYDQLLQWKNEKNDAANRMEIDFLIHKETVTSRHNISPIEVKSGTNYSLNSLTKCIL